MLLCKVLTSSYLELTYHCCAVISFLSATETTCCNFQAYLSLPEGTASVVGLIAMMTDHYNVLVCSKLN